MRFITIGIGFLFGIMFEQWKEILILEIFLLVVNVVWFITRDDRIYGHEFSNVCEFFWFQTNELLLIVVSAFFGWKINVKLAKKFFYLF